MATGLNAIAELARDDGFRQRVRSALVIACRDVGSEAGALEDDYHLLRRTAAQQCALYLDDHVDGAAWLTASNPVIKRSSDDDDVQFTVNSIFPVLAACGPPPVTP